MTSDKKNISILAELFVAHGLTNIVISPGSRNAPIILSFANRPEIIATSIIDERSAAFFALGMALQTNSTVAIACTSGSAVLNYASAISEAYYQHIPLLVITADRPENLVDVGDGQTIRQRNIFSNFINDSFHLPEDIVTDSDFNNAQKIINKALQSCVYPVPGPVHINIPFAEPIYGTTEEKIFVTPTFPNLTIQSSKISVINNIIEKFSTSKKVMIIAGQNRPNAELTNILCDVARNSNAIILTETTSNLHCESFIDTIDNVISSITKSESEIFKPDILISFGGQVVSKIVKKFLRNNNPNYHWHISPSGESMDTYSCLTEAISTNEVDFFNLLENNEINSTSDYASLWKNKKEKVDIKKKQYLDKIDFSDLKVFESIEKNLPKNTVLHLGNSTPVRYSQLFGSRKSIEYNSNRGVSGIDGQVSTAVGYSYHSDRLNILITGDIGFLYDSNGLMNYCLKPNLKIIVINNQGGGIFKFIPGPDTTPNLETFFEAKHNWSAEYICKAFGVVYLQTDNYDELQDKLNILFEINNDTPTLLEIKTPSEKNAIVLREYFKFIAE